MSSRVTSNIHEYIRIYIAEYRIYEDCVILNSGAGPILLLLEDEDEEE